MNRKSISIFELFTTLLLIPFPRNLIEEQKLNLKSISLGYLRQFLLRQDKYKSPAFLT